MLLEKAVQYLRRYGYITEQGEINEEQFTKALAKFQSFIDLDTQHGVLTDKTLRVMSQPRCALPDNMMVAANAKWRKKDLTYFIEAYVGDGIDNAEQDAIIKLAFDQWSAHADIRAKQIGNRNADIIISVGRGRKDQFDGDSGTLAWAYLPSGDDRQLLMKFDMDETWVGNTQNRGIRLLNVACHEIGHLLGLEHSSIQTALMAPYYNVNISKPQDKDDVSRIINLYGKAQVKPDPVPDPTPTPTPSPKQTIITINGSVDNIVIPGYRVTKLG